MSEFAVFRACRAMSSPFVCYSGRLAGYVSAYLGPRCPIFAGNFMHSCLLPAGETLQICCHSAPEARVVAFAVPHLPLRGRRAKCPESCLDDAQWRFVSGRIEELGLNVRNSSIPVALSK